MSEKKKMNEQELNKKLAEWAGFTKIIQLGSCLCGYPPNFIYKNWNKLSVGMFPIPNFTQSLDACFRWLVPKFKEMCTSRSDYKGFGTCDNSVHIFLRLCEGQGWATKGWLASIRGFRTETMVEGVDSPALAFCRALEKFIE